ncbi:type II restriction enzyme [Corynebacterium minutissimum]|uniref:type II restriction enzyme n=1 Tax=Corynebacterium minutissimum TaxID=38301 RepID=UPI001EF1ED6D|nr:hypothetical protein [Corynebacterium minutissimum]MCG7228859.1 hypothetical protein [Corynebacterium minutissimum]MCG7237976.1 hypothetical protein [Corynebacterium minutissimum]
MLNDAAWDLVFPHIQAEIAESGFRVLEASELKRLSGREPRLMAKHDFSAARPKVFQEHGLSMLPIRRDAYLIGRFDLYQPFPEQAGPLTTMPVPRHIKSIDFDNLSSEAAALTAASLSGMVDDFIGAECIATVSGRMSTLQLPMTIGGREVVVDRAQMEIDAGFESAEHLVLLEAKNHVSPDFNIRQLYFPFRRFSLALDKEVIPVYMVYCNGVFHFYRYAFRDPADFRSIELVAAHRYILGPSTVTAETVRSILAATQIERPGLPFPQADSFARVISLLENPVPKADMPEQYGFTPRQADYYTNAARYLGLTELRGTRDERNAALIQALASRPVFRDMLTHVVDTCRALSKDEAYALMRSADLGLKESTLRRRSSTVAAWSQWVAELLEMGQLRIPS